MPLIGGGRGRVDGLVRRDEMLCDCWAVSRLCGRVRSGSWII